MGVTGLPNFKLIPILKTLLIVVIGLFVLKMLSGYVTSKWPNKVTNAVNTVIQAD